MKKSLTRSLVWALGILLLGATGAFGADVSMRLVNAGAGYVMGGVYTSPYTISVDGTPTLLICDDFVTNISFNQTWNAQVTPLADLQTHSNPSGTPAFYPAPASASVRDYATAAVLAAQLMGLGNFYSETAGELSYAIWGIFDPTLLTANPPSGEGHLTGTQLLAAQGYLAAARAVVTGATNQVTGAIDLSQLPSLTIYTPDPLYVVDPITHLPTSSRTSQEFLRVSMAEPSFIAMLGVDLLGIVGFILFLRRRFARTSN